MSLVDESRRRRTQNWDIDPHTAGAEDPETTPEQIAGMIDKVLTVGTERKAQLDELAAKRDGAVEHLRDGTYWIRSSHIGQYADFYERANHEYLKGKYKWLHTVSEGLGFDEDKGIESHNTFEDYLASIPHEEWVAFMEDMDQLEDYPLLDEERASELEMEEGTRWVTEDGGPDLIEAMRENTDDAYEAYLLNTVTTDLIFEWMRETDNYPEAQGQGDVWMKMDELGKERETQEWFLDHLDDDVKGWEAIKRAQFEDMAGDRLDALIRTFAQTDEDIAHVYARMDIDALWNIFLQTFPDERRNTDDPYWYFWKPQYNQPGVWRVGYEPDTHNVDDWKTGYGQTLEYLSQQDWFIKLLRSWFSRPPEGHPRFKFEALGDAPSADPDDPGIFMRYGGGLVEGVVYEDDRIVVMYPRDLNTINYHIRNGGWPEMSKEIWSTIKHDDIFVVLGKQPVDMLGHTEKRELGVIYGGESGLSVWTGSYSSRVSLNNVLSNPEYGKSVRRMLLRYYRERLQSDDKAAHVLLQLGGAPEIRRGERRGELNSENYGITLGMFYVKKHKYGLAAKAFKRSPQTITPKGVWLYFDGVEDLTPVFKNEDAASTVFANDHYDWFDHYWEKASRPPVENVIPFLDKETIDHIRSVMVNRRVYFPDGGPEGKGEYVVLTPKILAEYDDDTILNWLAHPADEDVEDGVFDDIIEAIQLAGVDILQQASTDEVFTGFIKAAVDAIDGAEHKWVKHPTKKGADAFAVFVPWDKVEHCIDTQMEEHGYVDGSLEDLVVNANADTIEPDVNNMEASWSDVKPEWAKEQLGRITELEPPDTVPGSPDYEDPNQLPLPMGEGIDDPEAMPDMLSGIPVELEHRVKAILRDSMAEHNYAIRDLKFELEPSREYSDEDIDASDGRLINYPAHHRLFISYLPEPVPDWGVTQWVFKKVRDTVVNMFKTKQVSHAYMVGADAPDEPEDLVVFRYGLFDVIRPEPEPDAEQVPF